MNIKQFIHTFSVLVIIFLFSSCSEYSKLLKSSDYDLKYTKALEYYENEKYLKAKTLLEELIPVYRGKARGEEVAYHYSYSHYHQEEYMLAAYYFQTFSQTYPNSKYAEETEFMSAYCYYLDSPEYTLDQSNTYKAINELQLFINKHPDSKRIKEADELIDKLRQKLETKSYKSARLYFRLGDYKAAITALQNSLDEFPDSDYREELMYLVVEASFKLAENSIKKVQLERYESTIEAYQTFISEFPKSKSLSSAEKLYNNTLEKIKELGG